MLERYVKIRDAILTAVEDLVPRGHAHRRVSALLDKLCELCLRDATGRDVYATQVRLLFDACSEKYPIMADYLSPSTAIVHTPAFESALVKLQNNLPLGSDEQRAIDGFILPTIAPTTEAPTKTDVGTSVLRQAKKPRLTRRCATAYDPLLVCATPISNTCERQFSECKLVLTSLRSSTLPANFETSMFLRANGNM
ncbi:LOW QUALITY PROTEIN: hypothetical protein PHMEG_00036716 [Phytophthora megakarya]|uniref:HAT C-terminal dimerisation domain-containing protein n=1 Tax=Phytophthora megakarya TaxID=4795 RepID=A0A225UMJ9_9STRA|nr:LOW QUALITY PROTEIN: hypothetical protein PHMEG_00036716 [Phytophthora megakarya]